MIEHLMSALFLVIKYLRFWSVAMAERQRKAKIRINSKKKTIFSN